VNKINAGAASSATAGTTVDQPVTHSYCNNLWTLLTFQLLLGDSLTKCLVNGMFTNNQWRWKCVISAFEILQPIKDVIANGHDKLNRLMIAQTPQLFSAKILKLGDECRRYSKPNQCYFRYTAWLKRPNFWGSYFPRYFRDTSKGRWDNKSTLNSVLTQQHLCKKSPKLVNVRWSYSVLHQCRFFRHSV